MTEDVTKKLEAIGLGMRAAFVPFSRSRNKAESHKSLNWDVTVTLNGRDVLTVPYSAGIGHCPSFNVPVHPSYDRPARMWRDAVCGEEAESGVRMTFVSWGGFRALMNGGKKIPILPKLADVMYSLTMDSSVLQYATFEEWAGEYGLDVDSRKAEAVYQDCLKTALALNRALGTQGLAYLVEVFENY